MEIFKKVKAKKDSYEYKENPNLNAKNVWNSRISEFFWKYRAWQLISILSLLVTLVAISGVIYIGSQSKFIPYIVEVNKLGETIVVGRTQTGTIKDPRIIRARVANFIDTLRLVSIDPALQRNYIYKTYESLRRGDPAFEKANIFYQDNKTNPFKLGKNISRNIEIKSLNRQTDETYQIDWLEKTYDKKGILLYIKEFRALVTVFLSPVDVESVDQLIENPLGIYIKDYNISELKTSENDIIKKNSEEVYEDENK